MNKEFIIQSLIDHIDAKTYLEIGVNKGASFMPINCQRKLGVDPEIRIRLSARKKILREILNTLRGRKERLFEMTSDDFFKEKSNLFKKKLMWRLWMGCILMLNH